MAGPLSGVQRSKHDRMSGLSRISVVLIPGSEGQNLARTGPVGSSIIVQTAHASSSSSALASFRSAVSKPSVKQP
jgi:hypothetical protein